MGQYRAIAKIGHGGMAEVRLAIAQRAGGFNKLLVLKLLREELAADAEFLEMFLAEARVAALLNHPNIVQTNEVGQDGDRYFIAMEYLEGQPLSGLIARLKRRNMPLDIHVFALIQALHGLHYAHELTDLNGAPLSLIHRDVSPQNVFLTYTGQVKLLDFGIAKIAGAAGHTKTGILKGKIGYMAPEQARMAMDIDRRADIFAVGIMLWEALAAQRFVPTGEAEVATLQRRLANEEQKLADVAPDADPTLAAICNKAVAHEPDERWSDAQTFAEALEAWLPRPKHVLEKELGTLLSDSFRDERSRIRRVIEEVSAKPIGAETSSPDLRELLSSNLESARVDSGGRIDSGARLDSGTTRLDSGTTRLDSANGTGVATNDIVPAGGRRLKWTLALAVVAAAGVGGAVFFSREARREPVTTTSQSVDAPRLTRLQVRTVPANATVKIDDGSPRAAPFDITVPKDDARHTLRVAAEGYETEERAVSLSNDLDLEITLKKTPAAPAASVSVSNGATATPPAPAFVGRARPVPKAATSQVEQPVAPVAPPKKTPRHSIDETDPYAK